MFHFKKLSVLALAGLVSACAAFDYDLATVEGQKLSGDTFKNALHSEYLTLAREEDKEDDWEDAAFFADRATQASGGAEFGPQMVEERMIPNANIKEISFARSSLVNALATEKNGPNAAHVARAQAKFDCWLQEQEENTQPEDIAKCRADFKDAMGSIVAKAMPAPKAAPAPTPKMKLTPRTFVVYFDHDSSAFDSMAIVAIVNALQEARATGPKLIEVSGHTDTTGNVDYNIALSEKRAKAVANQLFDGGLRAKNLIKTGMFGENATAVKTQDNVKNRGNRRVEITLTY